MPSLIPADLPLVHGASLEAAAAWFFENSSDGFALSKGGILLRVNRAWLRICRCGPEDAVGRTGVDIIHPDDLGSFYNGEAILTATGVVEFENRLRTGDDGWVWVRTSVKRGPDGYAMIVIHDITDERAKAAMAEESAKTNDLLRSAAGVITWRFNPDTGQYVADHAFNAEGGVDVAAGDSISTDQVAAGIHPDDYIALAQAFLPSLKTGKAGQFWYRHALPDGHWAHFRSSWRGAKQCESGQWELIGIAQDMTEIVEARDDAVRGEQAARAAEEIKSQFLANMSHEIRTPLNGVLGVLQLLRNEPLSAETRRMVDDAVACGGVLTALLNDILDLSTIEGEQAELSPEAVDAAAIVGSVAQMLRPQIEGKGLYMRTVAPALAGPVWVDPVRLRQVLLNLIGNAAKFTLRGGISIRMTGLGSGDSHRLRIEVEDTGVGIAQAAQAELFNRFHQADGSVTRRFGGSGLGLAITRRLAELMGGDVGVESQVGRGSTFWIEIAAPIIASNRETEQPAHEILDGMVVLVVDDNSTNRIIAARMLEHLGALVETAENGALGVEAAARGGFDLIFMDIQMPVMDGVEATRRIRAMAAPVGQTPILAMTANVMLHQTAQYRAVGMDGVIAKPLSPAAIVAEIARLVEPLEDRAAS